MDQENQQQQGLLLESNHNSTNVWLGPTTLSHHRIFINDDDDEEEEEVPTQEEEECPYSRPFVVLDLIWNSGFVLVAAFVLLTTFTERPTTPLRLWIAGYALQCLLHVGFVWFDCQRAFSIVYGFHGLYPFSLLSNFSFVKRLESINTLISSIWWVFGFYWIYTGGQALLQDSPHLYWLSVVFLAFDVFFMIFCIAMACIIFFLLVCCFPLLARVAYAITIGEGASEDDIRTLPKYRYRQPNTPGVFNCCKKQEEAGSIAHFGSNNNMPGLAFSVEDSECCICLHGYEEGVEMCALPCNHHFHYRCICKWLRINATCPLCKFNILQGETSV
ncbi:hypothetical protein ACH5RR_007580 [Cinchona calisaya]|uniref:RING-type E3 ubiquitin transferase n=1 Tax=Cinchona calisaya TaxID=153742 RepID=A0ABD3AS65_9GENT